MDASDYATRAGLTLNVGLVRQAQQDLWRVLDAAKKASLPATPSALSRLYSYRVPKLSADGSCSLVNELEPTPYDLGRTLGGRDLRTSLSLLVLHSLLDKCVEVTQAAWLGVYQARELESGRTLVKLAYRGRESRAEFPLTEAFAAKSTNATVGLTGKARVLADVRAHVAAGGGYYECDPAVQAEVCVPVFTETGALVGIIDAEATQAGFFNDERLAAVVALALEVQAHFP
jgi:putative methionine-R-sulfoxide reductase with GAF domain